MEMTMSLNRILYVEDEPDITAVVKMTLESIGGYQVDACSSGPEALEKAAAGPVDLILLDVMMPGMDGPATLAALREIPATLDTPVVFMTAKTQTEEVARYRSLGVADVIAKPFDPMALPGRVAAIWSEHIECHNSG